MGAESRRPISASGQPKEGFGIENVGIPPDIEVEQFPAGTVDGGDPQLERAIEEIKALEANPSAKRERSPFPVRVRRGGGA